MSLSIVILAAGQGTRMRSKLPKVMHTLAGTPLLEHVYRAAMELDPGAVHVVYGHGGEHVREALGHLDCLWVQQAEQLGTGHAVAQAMPNISDDDLVLVLYGDVPMTSAQTLRALVEGAGNSGFALLTVDLADPSGYGRIVRGENGGIVRIVEQKDASEAEQQIHEINTGLLAVSARRLKDWLAQLSNHNAQGEYYLTDVVAMAVRDGVVIESLQPAAEVEVLGVNDRAQLAELERCYQLRQAQRLMAEGVGFADPGRFDLRGEITVGRDIFIDVNAVMEGRVFLGDGVRIGPNCMLKDTRVGEGAQILANCVIEGAIIGQDARIGPFARIRPETQLGDQVRVGNFVEIKKTQVARGSKINHLSYVGDSILGERVNVGAGTITCNYDGAFKHQTVIEDDVFIGSDTQLVAPVTIGRGATIGAGTTVTKDAPPHQLTLGRARQQSIKDWERPKKNKI